MSTENSNIEALLAQMMAKLDAAEKRAEAAEKKAAEAANVASRGKARIGEPSRWIYKGMKLNHFVGRGGKRSDKPFTLVATFRKEHADGTPALNAVNGQESWINSGNGIYADWMSAMATVPAEDLAIFADPSQVEALESDKDLQAKAKAESAERNAKRAEKGSGKQTGIGESDIARALAFLGRRK